MTVWMRENRREEKKDNRVKRSRRERNDNRMGRERRENKMITV